MKLLIRGFAEGGRLQFLSGLGLSDSAPTGLTSMQTVAQRRASHRPALLKPIFHPSGSLGTLVVSPAQVRTCPG